MVSHIMVRFETTVAELIGGNQIEEWRSSKVIAKSPTTRTIDYQHDLLDFLVIIYFYQIRNWLEKDLNALLRKRRDGEIGKRRNT